MEEIIQTASAGYKPYDTKIAEHLVKLINGTATADSTIELTEFIRVLIANNWQPKNELDKQFQTHCLYVANQLLQHLRKEGLSKESLEACGKLLIRL